MSPTTIEVGRLSPASQLTAGSTAHFPNESAQYRTARNALLAGGIELRRRLERFSATTHLQHIYGSEHKTPCPMCTSFPSAWNGIATYQRKDTRI
jgi:predicted dithiol-disulfide oxidoreductase (DUF899 family)